MKLEDIFTGQTVAVVEKKGTVRQGSLGYVVGYSESHNKVLVHLLTGGKVYLAAKELIGILEVIPDDNKTV